MWSLLFSHQIQNETLIPAAALQHIAEVAKIVAEALRPFMNGASDDDRDNAARALWCGIHGITAVAVTQKGPKIKSETVHTYVQLLTSTFTKGLKA